MKKFTLPYVIIGLLIFGIGFTGYAQNFSLRHIAAKTAKVPVNKVASKMDDGIGTKPPNVYVSSRSVLDDPSTMMTKYDLGTNNSNQNRIYQFTDGKIAATAQWSHQDGGWSDRGTGYNIYDGTSWGTQPTSRIEDEKIGWPSIAPLGTDGEIVVSHTMTAGLKVCTRPTKGQGAWTQSVLPGPAGAVDISWPRMVTNGPNHTYVHIIATTYSAYQGLTPYALLYYRSLDGGQTWDIEHQILDGMTSSDYLGFSADIYNFAEPHGDTLAFVVGDSWMDEFIMKSTDNGNTWTKTVIWPCPYNFWAGSDDVPDFRDADGTTHVALDQQGMAHVVFGLGQGGATAGVKHWTINVDGLVYWNEYMPPFPEVLDWDTLYKHGNLIGWIPDKDTSVFYDPNNIAWYQTSMTSNPGITIDADNNIFVIWSGVTSLTDADGYYLKHIYERTAKINPDHNVMWQDSLTDLTSDFLQYNWMECMYPDITANSDDKIYVLFQGDEYAGSYVKGLSWTGYVGQTGVSENNMIVLSPSKSDLYVGIKDKGKPSPGFSVSTNYPNPFNGKTVVNTYLQKLGDLSLEITDIMGQNMMRIDKGYTPAGSCQFVIDGSQLSSGIYFYTVRFDNQSITQKMIVQ